MADDHVEQPGDPVHELIQRIVDQRHEQIKAHEELRASQPYRAVIVHIDRLLADYGKAINAIDLMATRHPPYFETLITLRMKQHFVQSVVASIYLLKDGMLDPARRELRFLLEASVKTLWLDRRHEQTTVTAKNAPGDVAAKVVALGDLGERRFREIVSDLKFGLLSHDAAKTYRDTATDLYTSLSTYSHVSAKNVERDLSNFDRGNAFGNETVRDIGAFAMVAKRVLDLALASHFEAFDHGLVGDILVQVFDTEPRWTFHKTPLVGAINRHFDYKAERQP
jgi:hypothetical protein